MNERECYTILGVKKNDTDADIKKAYRDLAKRYHPDTNSDKEAAHKFAQISEAYRDIMDIRHNRQRHIINRILIRPKKNTAPPPKRGSDVRTNVDISFEESLRGCKKKVLFTRTKRCECGKDGVPDMSCIKCEGKGDYRQNRIMEVKIPAGVKNEQSLRIPGSGNSGEIGAENGDLVITVHVPKSTRYIVKDKDVYIKLSVTFPEAVMGATKTVRTIYGDTDCVIPPGTQSGTKICLDGKGICLNGSYGNEYVIINVVIPKLRDKSQLDILRKVYTEFYSKETRATVQVQKNI